MVGRSGRGSSGAGGGGLDGLLILLAGLGVLRGSLLVLGDALLVGLHGLLVLGGFLIVGLDGALVGSHGGGVACLLILLQLGVFGLGSLDVLGLVLLLSLD